MNRTISNCKNVHSFFSMKKWIASFLAIYLIIFNGIFTVPVFATESLASDGEIEQVIIGFKDDIDESLLAQIPHTLHHRYETIQAVSISVPKEYIEWIKNKPSVISVEKDLPVKIEEAVDVTNRQMLNWGYEQTVLKETNDLRLTGKGVKIAIIDTGVDASHPDLHISGGKGFIFGQAGYMDENGHGTHVAGIINAQNNGFGILGIAPDAEVYVLKALRDDGEGSLADVVRAIDWAIQAGMDIINLSLSTEEDSWVLRKIIEKAEEAGVFVVAASGNIRNKNGQTTPDILYPARYPNVVSVGALDASLNHTSFSYVGESLDFSAPGEDILSTYINETGYVYASGTSMAAPFVTGILALYKQAFPNMNPNELLEQLKKNTVDLGSKGWDKIYGYGMVTSPVTTFSDIDKERWYFPYVHEMEKNGYVNGFPDGTFQPESLITRGEVVTMIGRLLHFDGSNRMTPFPDVTENHYASGYIASAMEAGIITGFPDGTFHPDDPVSRGDAAVIIQRAFDLSSSTIYEYSDIDPHTYYAEAVNALTASGIINGYPDGTFRPSVLITRAELAAMIAKVENEDLRIVSILN